MKTLLDRREALSLAAYTIVAGLAPNIARSDTTKFDKILAGARAEGKLVAWMLLPAQPETHRAVIESFNSRFDLGTTVEWVPTSPNNANPRVIAEAMGNKVSVDIIGGAIDEVSELVKAGAVKPYPWTEVFGTELPGIAERESRVVPQYKGTALPYLDVHYGIAWNPNFVADAEVPRRFADLADPKWQGRFGLNSLFMVPLPILTPTLGIEETVKFGEKLQANRPVYARGTPAVAQSIVSGAVPVGVTIYSVAERSRRVGEPLKFKLFDDFIPESPVHMYIPENSPNPNTARLFAAWFAVEGYKVADKFEPMPRAGDPGSGIDVLIKESVNAGGEVVRLRSNDDLMAAAQVRERIALIMSGQQ